MSSEGDDSGVAVYVEREVAVAIRSSINSLSKCSWDVGAVLLQASNFLVRR